MNHPRTIPVFSHRIGQLLSALALTLACGPTHAATQADLQNVIQLRTLAQRSAKLALQVQLGVREQDSWSKLRASIRQFDEQLGTLATRTSDEDLQRAIHTIEYNWGELKNQLVSRNPDQVHLISEQLSLSILRARNAIAANLDKPPSQAAILAEQQDMLSQRMAKLYYLSCLGRPTQAEVKITRERFRSGMSNLSRGDTNERSKTQLGLAEIQWYFYEQALLDPQQLSKDPNRKVYLENIATTSDRISEVMKVIIKEAGKVPS